MLKREMVVDESIRYSPIVYSPVKEGSIDPYGRQISIDVTVFERLTLEEEAEGVVGNATAAGQVQSSTVASQTSGVTGGGKELDAEMELRKTDDGEGRLAPRRRKWDFG
nr:hypothetical protein Iba_chr07eCG7540 [Ipomoea batatas]GMD20636.1 hypothetical protein Iba_chr07fCG6720 [Ipomoea batatas]